MDEKAATSKKLFVFFDEFNTTDEVDYLKEIIIQTKFMGKKLPNNVYFIAACNPYRLKKVTKRISTGGLTKHSTIQKSKQMAFTVNPPPLSMIQLMWDYQQLTQ